MRLLKQCLTYLTLPKTVSKDRNDGLPVPRLTPTYIESLVVLEDYHHFTSTGITICCLTLKNGYSVVAEAACANPQLFDIDTGKKRSKRKALNKLMELEHYLLRQRLYEYRTNTPSEDVDNG